MHIEIAMALAIAGSALCVGLAAALNTVRKRKTSLKYLKTRCTLATELMVQHIPDSKKPGSAILNGNNVLLKPGCAYFFTYGRSPSRKYIQQLAHELKRIGCVNRNCLSLRLTMDEIKYPEVESVYGNGHVTISIPVTMSPVKLAAFIYHFIK